jgi:hypothetical protein
MESQPIQINALPEDAKGRYANLVSVTAQERDVVIDFISGVRVGTNPPQGQLVSRIFMNRFSARELARLLSEIEARWERTRYEAGASKESEEKGEG